LGGWAEPAASSRDVMGRGEPCDELPHGLFAIISRVVENGEAVACWGDTTINWVGLLWRRGRRHNIFASEHVAYWEWEQRRLRSKGDWTPIIIDTGLEQQATINPQKYLTD
jgi:hypothetical protein